MRECKPLNSSILEQIPKRNESELNNMLKERLFRLNRKIIILDDSPVQEQTSDVVPIYTNWDKETLKRAFRKKGFMFFILTKSRTLPIKQTEDIYTEIAKNIAYASKRTGIKFLIISQHDPAMRNRYPLETKILKEILEQELKKKYDGEIICPFLKEEGYYIMDNIHYVKKEKQLIPIGYFSKENTLSCQSSDLAEWIEEKTKGEQKASQIKSIPITILRKHDFISIIDFLLQVGNFEKVILNAVDHCDIKTFLIAFFDTISMDKEFLFYSSSTIAKILGDNSKNPSRTTLNRTKNSHLFLVSSIS